MRQPSLKRAGPYNDSTSTERRVTRSITRSRNGRADCTEKTAARSWRATVLLMSDDDS